MKKQFSPAWKRSTQVRKQRKYRYNAPLHLRQKMLSAHLSKQLRAEYRRRAIPIRTGDEVVVTTGQFRKKHGKVTEVDMKKLKIFIDGCSRKKVSGQEVHIPIDPSNVVITKANMDDKMRQKILRRKTEKKKVEKTAEKKVEKK